jgi:signal peptidase II
MDTENQEQPNESPLVVLGDSTDQNTGGWDNKKEAKRQGWHRDILLGPVAIVVFLIDQFTKTFVRENIGLGQSVPSEGFFRVTHAINTGSAFGLFANQTSLLIIASVIGISVLIYFYRCQSRPSFLLRLSLGLQIGGAFGNLTDRIALGYVVDFIDVGVWPIFNLADTAISVGIFMLLWVVLNNSDQKKPKDCPNPSESDD